jgi:hypothetical protein
MGNEPTDFATMVRGLQFQCKSWVYFTRLLAEWKTYFHFCACKHHPFDSAINTVGLLPKSAWISQRILPPGIGRTMNNLARFCRHFVDFL